MSLSTYFLEYGRHVARLRRRRRRAYAPTSNTASHDNHKENPSWVSFLSHDDYGASLGGPSAALPLQMSTFTIISVLALEFLLSTFSGCLFNCFAM